MALPLVSLITPTYNQAGLIGACIESALAQTSPSWEMIVVDDGSGDGTEAVVAGYRDPRIRYERLPHRGIGALAETFNHGIRLSRGELVAELEGDDTLMPDRLARQVGAFDDPAVVLSHGPILVQRTDGTSVYRAVTHPDVEDRLDVLNNRPVGRALDALFTRNVIWSQSVMMRRSVLVAAGGYRQAAGTHLVDYPTYMEMALHGTFRYVAGAALAVWRRHERSVTSTLGYGDDARDRIVAEFRRRHPELAAHPNGVVRERP